MEDKVLKKFQTIKSQSFQDFASLGHSKELIESEYLAAKINEGNLNALKDFVWHFFNKSILIFSRDFQKQAFIYWLMAVFDFKYGNKEKVFQMKKLSANARILHFQSDPPTIIPYEGRIIVPKNSCDVCIKDSEKIYEIDELLNFNPLPHENCSCTGIGCKCTLSFVGKRNADGSLILNLNNLESKKENHSVYSKKLHREGAKSLLSFFNLFKKK